MYCQYLCNTNINQIKSSKIQLLLFINLIKNYMVVKMYAFKKALN